MATLPIKVSSGNLETYEALLLQLADPPDVTGIDQLELTFGEVTQLFPTAFALMAAYVDRHRDPAKRALVLRRFGANPQSAKIERVMDAIGFLPAVAGDKGAVEPKPKTGILPLTRIDGDTEPDVLAQYLIDTICEVAQPTRDAKETLFVVVTELAENIQRHGHSESASFVCGQLSAQKKKIELCFVDSGIGIKKSLEGGKNPEIKSRIDDGETALAIALEAGITSKGDGHSGFGLFVVSEAIRLTRGSFRLTSGNETILISRDGEKYRTHAPWHGTVVNCLLNIDKLGSIAEAYRELPFPRGEHDRTIRSTGT